MKKAHESPWVMCVTSDCSDVHMLWDNERDAHDLDHGTSCRCCPSIAELDHEERDPHGQLVRYVIRHRPWVERARVPDLMPESL